jgi:hypothetical protein
MLPIDDEDSEKYYQPPTYVPPPLPSPPPNVLPETVTRISVKVPPPLPLL